MKLNRTICIALYIFGWGALNAQPAQNGPANALEAQRSIERGRNLHASISQGIDAAALRRSQRQNLHHELRGANQYCEIAQRYFQSGAHANVASAVRRCTADLTRVQAQLAAISSSQSASADPDEEDAARPAGTAATAADAIRRGKAVVAAVQQKLNALAAGDGRRGEMLRRFSAARSDCELGERYLRGGGYESVLDATSRCIRTLRKLDTEIAAVTPAPVTPAPATPSRPASDERDYHCVEIPSSIYTGPSRLCFTLIRAPRLDVFPATYCQQEMRRYGGVWSAPTIDEFFRALLMDAPAIEAWQRALLANKRLILAAQRFQPGALLYSFGANGYMTGRVAVNSASPEAISGAADILTVCMRGRDREYELQRPMPYPASSGPETCSGTDRFYFAGAGVCLRRFVTPDMDRVSWERRDAFCRQNAGEQWKYLPEMHHLEALYPDLGRLFAPPASGQTVCAQRFQ